MSTPFARRTDAADGSKRTKKQAKPEHVPTPLIVAVVAQDDWNVLRLQGTTRLGKIKGSFPMASAGRFKLVLLDVSHSAMGFLLGRDVEPIDVEFLAPEELGKLKEAMACALHDLPR